MSELLSIYADTTFIEAMVALAPAVGWGFILGIIAGLVGFTIKISSMSQPSVIRVQKRPGTRFAGTWALLARVMRAGAP